jgi:hypothetical protein
MKLFRRFSISAIFIRGQAKLRKRHRRLDSTDVFDAESHVIATENGPATGEEKAATTTFETSLLKMVDNAVITTSSNNITFTTVFKNFCRDMRLAKLQKSKTSLESSSAEECKNTTMKDCEVYGDNKLIGDYFSINGGLSLPVFFK